MKNPVYTLVLSLLLFGCKTTKEPTSVEQPVHTTIDLVNVQNDKIKVSIDPGRFTTDQTAFYIPKIVPGTYKVSDYGKFSEDFKALDYKGRELEVVKRDQNSWLIPNAKKLDKVTYWVNDTFDAKEQNVYSMAGTNTLEGENFLLNLHGFVGYFEDLKEII